MAINPEQQLGKRFARNAKQVIQDPSSRPLLETVENAFRSRLRNPESFERSYYQIPGIRRLGYSEHMAQLDAAAEIMTAYAYQDWNIFLIHDKSTAHFRRDLGLAFGRIMKDPLMRQRIARSLDRGGFSQTEPTEEQLKTLVRRSLQGYVAHKTTGLSRDPL